MQEITNLQKVICVVMDVHLWSGRAKLREQDLRIIEGTLPPSDLASLGSKKIFDPGDISTFEALKKEAERECAKVGIRFLGGYAVPEDKASDLALVLDDIGQRFADAKTSLLAEYDDKLRDWVTAHPGWESVISAASLDRDEVDAKLSYGWQAFKIVEASPNPDVDSPLNKGLATTAKGLAGQLYSEIAQAAGAVMDKSLLGRDRTTQKILSPVRTIKGKMLGLSFIDHRVKPLVETIDHVLSLLPDAGHIEGAALVALHGLIFILSDEKRMVQHAEMILDGKPVEESFLVSVPQAAKVEIMPEPEPEPEQQQETETTSPEVNSADTQDSPSVYESPIETPIPAIPAVTQKGPVKGLFF